MTLLRRTLVLTLAITPVLAGCGGKRPPTPVERQIPAPKEPPAPPAARAERLDPALLAAARAELDTAVLSTDPIIRSHAIEAAQHVLGKQGKSIYLNGLQDKSAQVRFASAMAIGQLQLAEAKGTLEQMINDPNQRVGIAVRYALHRLGDHRYTKDLETTARDPQWAVRADTALALGMLGEPTAVRLLVPMQRDPQAVVRLQVAEALWRLGNEDGLHSLVSATQSGYPDDQMVALLGLAAAKDRRVMGHLRAALTADYPEVCLVAARAMGMLGSDAGYSVAAEGIKSRDPRRRTLAALALGAIGRSDAQQLLADPLREKDAPDTRLCAAQALLQLKPTTTARTE
jgi:HEAT repeat protein